jgi:predicted DNA-binding transcriptional regulator AlpA
MKRLLRLNEIIGPRERRIPLGKSAWWQGVKDGRFPKPIKLSPRCTCWREEDIDALIERLGAPQTGEAA